MIHKLSRIIKILFQRVPIERLFTCDERKKIYYDDLKLEYLQELMLTYHKQFSDTEMRMQIDELHTQMNNGQNCIDVMNMKDETIEVFSVLSLYVSEILVFYENRVVCRYNRLLEWNDLIKTIGEELPVLSMVSMRDSKRGIERKIFTWSPVIGHNNSQLNRILEKGMADNHFHLRGSSPYFQINWINLMNYPGRNEFIEKIDKIEKDYRDKNKKSETLIQRQPLRILVMQAALIRLYLSSRLTKIRIKLVEYYISYKDIMPFLRKNINPFQGMCLLEEYREYVTDQGFNKLWDIAYWRETERMLENPYYLEINIDLLQSTLQSLSMEREKFDYMLQFSPDKYLQGEEEYRILSGERWFIYSMLKMMLKKDDMFTRKEYNLFYAYLRVKNEIRSELMQVNNMVGFENFQIYQRRKDYFSHVDDFLTSEKRLARLAVKDVLNNPTIKFLEVRISPGKTAAENAENICEYDDAIINPGCEESFMQDIQDSIIEKKYSDDLMAYANEDLRNKFYYVLHFHKTKDVLAESFLPLECRHYEYRQKIRVQAHEILRFRREYPQYGKRVVGIDACAQEIGCRPEVFACVFRFLKNDSVSSLDGYENFQLPQLKITYHVGEDFLDIVDGLRAIDEAIRFLNIDCGDRLGHALALGIDAKQWYNFKGKQITISLQDYLDNIVWMHHALIKYNIKKMGTFLGWLEEQYSHYFTYIYQPYIKKNMYGQDMKDKASIQGNFDINTYHLSWLLRGDEPALYKLGTFKKEESYVEPWERYAVNKENKRSDDIRNIPEVALMYYMYHYNKEVRVKGSENKTISISDNYIECVELIQKEMREEVVKRGISIETNPSSNIQIGTFSSYAQHPIKVFYNMGLTKNENELMECPQMNVSINTDDKGIFSTRLENEYALLACALENELTPEGKMKYKKEFIYKWLDNIREMGIRQTFVSDGEQRW